jgi:hypothetical protein
MLFLFRFAVHCHLFVAPKSASCSHSPQSFHKTSPFNPALLSVVMHSPSIVRLLLLTGGLAVGIAMLAGNPAPDGYHKGLLRVHFMAN